MQPYLNYLDDQEYKKLEDKTHEESARLNIEYHAPEKIEPMDFVPPDGVQGVWINKSSGHPTSPQEPGAFYEYFIKGTEPDQIQDDDR